MGLIHVVKFSAKVGLAGGAVYYANEYDMFGTHAQSTSGYDRLRNTVSANEYYREFAAPLVTQAVEGAGQAIPKDVLPEPQAVRTSIRHYWNYGVMATFSGLANLPSNASHYGKEAVSYVSSQLEAKPEEVKKSAEKQEEEVVDSKKVEPKKEEAVEPPKKEELKKEESKKKSGWF